MLDFELVFFVSAVHTTFQKRNPSVDLGRFCCRGEQPASPRPFVKLCECGDGELWWRGPCPSWGHSSMGMLSIMQGCWAHPHRAGEGTRQYGALLMGPVPAA